MLQDTVVVEVEKRTETGKNACNRLRAKDLIPAVLYGGHSGAESLPLSVPRKDLLALFRKGLHQNAVFRVHVKGADEQPHVMVRDVMLSPLRRELVHLDFVRVLLDRKLKVKVPVETVGTAIGVKLGGLLDVVTRELEVECLPADIPASIQADVSNLDASGVMRVADLALGEKVQVLGDPDRVIAHIVTHKTEEAATADAAPAAEPEVVKKGKKEEEGAAKPAAKAAPKADKKEKK
ncbi:MAG TPA: 50S ribosomal protein L25 [Thermoanaerobaculia bacterium]|nr:50S ribosomal protein L25 [Thermoanaerobaculia bacterium]HQP85835.1 50S ribosomal protein L25 [Thermoanaerobaculia bacterium]